MRLIYDIVSPIQIDMIAARIPRTAGRHTPFIQAPATTKKIHVTRRTSFHTRRARICIASPPIRKQTHWQRSSAECTTTTRRTTACLSARYPPRMTLGRSSNNDKKAGPIIYKNSKTETRSAALVNPSPRFVSCVPTRQIARATQRAITNRPRGREFFAEPAFEAFFPFGVPQQENWQSLALRLMLRWKIPGITHRASVCRWRGDEKILLGEGASGAILSTSAWSALWIITG